MTTLEILRAARELLGSSDRRTIGAYARDANGVAVRYADDGAVCWCAAGAVYRVAGSTSLGEPAVLALQSAKHVCGSPLGEYHDSLSHKEVLGWFDRAISKLEAQQP